MTPPRMEPMEVRRLLSVTLAESEPNNSMATADAIPRELEKAVTVGGRINRPGDRDWFKIKLKAGDVIGAATSAQGDLDMELSLFDAAGRLMMYNDDFAFDPMGDSPLPTRPPS